MLHAVVGDRVLVSTHGRFVLVDPVTGDEVRLPTPPTVGSPRPGALSPDGDSVAIEYRSPAQIMDLWLLHVATLEWSRAPSMPVHAIIKRPAPVWTPDGRLAVVGHFGTTPTSDHLLVVWNPAAPHLAISEVVPRAIYVLV